jgi:hypothetical protein
MVECLMQSSEITIAIFALIGAVIGAVTSFLGTYLTLRHQESVRRREIRLRELEKRRNDIESLISDLGALDLATKENGSIKFDVGSSPAARSVFFRLITHQVGETKLITSMAHDEVAQVLAELKYEKDDLTTKINDYK